MSFLRSFLRISTAVFVEPGAWSAATLAMLASLSTVGSLRMAFYESTHPSLKQDWFRFDLYRGLTVANLGFVVICCITLADPALLYEGQIGYGLGMALQAGIVAFLIGRMAHIIGNHPLGGNRG